MKKKTTTSARPARPAPTPSTLQPSVPDERVKLSLVLNRRHLVAGQRVAREIGISFNGFVNLAIQSTVNLYTQQQGFVPPVPASLLTSHQATGTPLPVYVEGSGPKQGLAAFGNRPPDRTKPPASPVGDGFTLPGDEAGETCYAPWPVVERYAAAQRKHPADDFLKMAKRLKLDPAVARAADVAQASPEFDRWMTWATRQRKKGAAHD